MIEIDGSEGGGGLVRTALTLAALTGESVRIEAIRGARPNPGLRPQHLAAVRSMARICDAEISGASVDSETLTFRPGSLRGGTYATDIGTAGSLTLLFDTVLPLAIELDAPLSLTATGGTDVKWSPTAAYLQRVKLPLLRQFGVEATVDIERTGFYPVGNGEATLHVEPSTIDPLVVTGRGSLAQIRIYSKASVELENRSVAERQATTAAEMLATAGHGPIEQTTWYVDTASVGSAIGIRLTYEQTIAGFDALGERGKPAEEVGRDAAGAACAFDDGTAAVDEHMADQLLVFLALAGGHVSIPRVTDHVEAGRRLHSAFGIDLSVEDRGDGAALLSA